MAELVLKAVGWCSTGQSEFARLATFNQFRRLNFSDAKSFKAAM
jgi:hypothetical protein